MPQTPSTRWCPTPEQLMILEEMYRSGVRTPNAAEIQQITAHLAYYGRIEGKNVFYWFQNHKARERQRLRRRLCARHQQQYAQAQQQAPSLAAAAGGSGGSGGAGASSVHPAVMQLHHHHPYAASFMPQAGYFQQDAMAAPLAAVSGMEFAAACKTSGDPNGGGIGGGAYGGGGGYQQQQDWTAAQMMDCCGAAGSSESADMIPPCCRQLKTLDLFPTKSTGLKDECCSSSKSSSCSTSTN